MLDKTIPYKNILMRWDLKEAAGCGEKVQRERFATRFAKQAERCLPTGWTISNYEAGDAENWVRIQKAAGEFEADGEQAVLRYFMEHYAVRPEELAQRCLFVRTASGKAVGTCLAWREDGDGVSSLHWLAVQEDAQGRGAGSALIAAALARYLAWDAVPVWLHTQPWSHQAIRLYRRAGFSFVLDSTCRFGGYENETQAGLEVLRKRNLLPLE